jgi:ankyrin repeat protein
MCTTADAVTMSSCESMSYARETLEDADPRSSDALVRAMHSGNWDEALYWLISGTADAPSMTPSERATARRLRNSLALIPLAAAGDDAAIERRLAQRANPNIHVRADDYMTPLAWAARCDHPSTIRLLLANGASIDQRVGYVLTGWYALRDSTALIEATRSGAVEAVRELLRHGADPNLRDGYERLALREIRGRAPELRVVEELPGSSPIVATADIEILELLLQAGADPDLANGDGETALMHAAERGDRDAVTALLAHGADPTIQSHAGASAISIAQRRRRQDILVLLQDSDAGLAH